MPVHNSEIAGLFSKVADLLEIEGANQFRVRAYRKAARNIASYPRSMASMVADGKDLSNLDGIGEDLAGKIEEIVETSDLAQLKEIERRTPAALADMLKIAGLGPKRVQSLHEELGVATLNELEQAAKDGKIRDIEGFGPKTEQRIIDELERRSQETPRTRIDIAEEMVGPLIEYLRKDKRIERVEVAGSYRRCQETVGDLDVLVIGTEGERIARRFTEYEDVDEIVSRGETRSTVLFRSGLQVDLRVVPRGSYGAALLYFTGSKDHNIALRNMAADRDWKVNEYGVFEGEKRIAGETEEEIYELFDSPFIPPELREDRGELQAAQDGDLPELVTLEQIQGDLQMHTTGSDGQNSLEKMVEASRERGYKYIAITGHSPHVAVAGGLDAEELARQIDAIDKLNDEMDGFRILKAIEVDILEDGSLDLADDVLAKLDFRLCSVHSAFDLSSQQQTERIIRAMDNPNFTILAHPTGRLIGERPPYNVDLEQIMEAALERGCFLEIDSHPARLDLNDVYIKMAREMGLKLSISTDAHSIVELELMRFGVNQARRGWLEADDVLNTRTWKELKKLLTR